METHRTDWQEDTQLAHKAMAGDERALRILYEAYADGLFAFISLSLDDDQAGSEDIWQETWIAAVDSLERFDGRSSFFTWLCAIARHKKADYFRRMKRQEIIYRKDSSENLDCLTGGPLPEELLQSKDTKMLVIKVLKSLPPVYRTVLERRYLLGERVEQVACSIQRSYKATESLLSRARKRFQVIFLRESGARDGEN